MKPSYVENTIGFGAVITFRWNRHCANWFAGNLPGGNRSEQAYIWAQCLQPNTADNSLLGSVM